MVIIMLSLWSFMLLCLNYYIFIVYIEMQHSCY